jgi:hypothetical protein
MTRSITAGMTAEVTAASLTPVFLMQMLVPSGALRFWNGIGTIDFDGDTYTGSANLITFSEIVETQAIEARGIQFTLNGINSSLVSTVLDSANELQRAPVDMWMACLDSDDNIITSPIKIFSGLVDTAKIREAGDSSQIVVNCENKLIRLKRTRTRRYTPEDQKAEYAGDLFYDFVPSLQDKALEWGKGQ